MLSKAKMKEYQRKRRERLKEVVQDAPGLKKSCKPNVNQPVNVNPNPVNPENCKPVNLSNVNPDRGKLMAAIFGEELLETGLPDDKPDIENYGLIDCQCQHCQQVRRSGLKLVINHGQYKPAELLNQNKVNRVSMPGDVDYEGVCPVTARAIE